MACGGRLLSTWSALLQEALWLSNDFKEERKWKAAAAIVLARRAAAHPLARGSRGPATHVRQGAVAAATARQVLAWWRQRDGHAASDARVRAPPPRRVDAAPMSSGALDAARIASAIAAAHDGRAAVIVLRREPEDQLRSAARVRAVVGRLREAAATPHLLVVPARAVGAWRALIRRHWAEVGDIVALRGAGDLWLPWQRARGARICIVGAEALSSRHGRELLRRDWSRVTFAWTNRRSAHRAEAAVAGGALRELAQCACAPRAAANGAAPRAARWISTPRGFACYADGCAVENSAVWSALVALALPRAFGALAAADAWFATHQGDAAALLCGDAPRCADFALLTTVVPCPLAPPPPVLSGTPANAAGTVRCTTEREALHAIVLLHCACNCSPLLLARGESTTATPFAMGHVAASFVAPRAARAAAARRELSLDLRVEHRAVLPRFWLAACRWLAAEPSVALERRPARARRGATIGSAATLGVPLERIHAVQRALHCARTRGRVRSGSGARHHALRLSTAVWAFGTPGLARCVALRSAWAQQRMPSPEQRARAPAATLARRCPLPLALPSWRAAVCWRAPERASAKCAALLRTLRGARAAGQQCTVLAHDAVR